MEKRDTMWLKTENDDDNDVNTTNRTIKFC